MSGLEDWKPVDPIKEITGDTMLVRTESGEEITLQTSKRAFESVGATHLVSNQIAAMGDGRRVCVLGVASMFGGEYSVTDPNNVIWFQVGSERNAQYVRLQPGAGESYKNMFAPLSENNQG